MLLLPRGQLEALGASRSPPFLGMPAFRLGWERLEGTTKESESGVEIPPHSSSLGDSQPRLIKEPEFHLIAIKARELKELLVLFGFHVSSGPVQE